MRTLGAYIAHFQHGVGHNLVLHRKVVVKVVRNLKGRVSGGSQGIWAQRCTGWCPGERVVEPIQGGSKGVKDCGGLDQRRIAEGVLLPNAIQGAVIEDAETRSHSPFAVPERIVREAETRPPVVV